MEISNPLGSWGSNPQPLGNLTEGIEALQRSEIEKQINEIATTKKQIRDDELWMLTQTPEIVDAKRTYMGTKIAAKAKEFTQDWADAAQKTKGKLMPLDEKIKVANGMRAVNELVADEKGFIKAMQEVFAKIPTVRAQLKYDSQRKDFDQRVAALVKRIQDPNDTPTILDLTEIFNIADRPPRALFHDVDVEIQKMIKEGRLPAKEGEWTPRDIDAITKAVKETVTGYGNDLLLDGRESESFYNPEEATQFFIDRNLPSVKQYFIRKPSEGGAGKRKENATSYSKAVTSLFGKKSLADGQEGVIGDWNQAPLKNIPFERTEEWDIASGDFTPSRILLNGMVEGSVKSTRKEPLYFKVNDLDEEVRKTLPQGFTETPVKGRDGESLMKLAWNEPVDEVVQVPYDQVRGLIKDVFPRFDWFYENRVLNTDQSPFRRSKVMKKSSYKFGDKKAQEEEITNMEKEMKQEKAGTKTKIKSDPLGLF